MWCGILGLLIGWVFSVLLVFRGCFVFFFPNWLLFSWPAHMNVCKMYQKAEPSHSAPYSTSIPRFAPSSVGSGPSSPGSQGESIGVFFQACSPHNSSRGASTQTFTCENQDSLRTGSWSGVRSPPTASSGQIQSNKQETNHFLYVQPLPPLTSLIIQFLVLTLF